MAKKNFKGGLNSLLGDEAASQPQPETSQEPVRRKEITKSTQEGTYEGEIRATFVIKEEQLETLKALAYWERKLIKNLIQEALSGFIKSKKPEYLQQVLTEFKKFKK